MPPIERDKQLHLLVSEEELDELKELAGGFGMTTSDYVRWMIGFHLREDRSAKTARSYDREVLGAMKKAELMTWEAHRLQSRSRKR